MADFYYIFGVILGDVLGGNFGLFKGFFNGVLHGVFGDKEDAELTRKKRKLQLPSNFKVSCFSPFFFRVCFYVDA